MKKLRKHEEEYKHAHAVALQSSRLVRRFKHFSDASHQEPNQKYDTFVQILSRSKYSISKRILTFLKRYPHVFNDKCVPLTPSLPPNYVNTNTIESIFGKYRFFFKSIRCLHSSKYTMALFEILHLKHNLSGSYTDVHKDISPLKRAGIHPRYHTLADALIPG